MDRQSLGRQFRWLWAAYAVSSFGTWLAFDAFSVIAILVLHAGAAKVSLLAAAGLAAGAVVAVPLGPWVEFRRKRPVMVAMDLTRFAAILSVPVAFALDRLSFGQLLLVSVITAAADITFTAASGACLKALLRPADLLAANSRLESTTWTATALGPPVGGAAIGLFGPVTTVLANAISFLLSALGIRAMGGGEQPSRPALSRSAPGRQSAQAGSAGSRVGDLLDGWRYLLGHRSLRPLLFNTALVNGLIMASAPPLAVLMLGRLGFAPWQYGLAFAVPCLGGLVGSRLAARLVARFGRAPGHPHRRGAAGLLAGGAGLHPARCGRPGAGHDRRTRPDHLRGSVQSGIRQLPAQPDGARPAGSHPVGLVRHQQDHRRRADRTVGCAGRPHRPAGGDRLAGLLLLATPLLLPGPGRLPQQPRELAMALD